MRLYRTFCDLCSQPMGEFAFSQPCGQCKAMMDNAGKGISKLFGFVVARMKELEQKIENLERRIE